MKVSSGEQEAGPFDGVPFSRFQFKVVALCALIAILDGFDTQSIGYAAPRIADDWGIQSAAFGPIFSAGLFGLAAGNLIFGPIADKLGRKPVIVIATAVFGSLTLLTAWVDTLNQLLILRFLAGIGLGAALPNIIALTCEYAPTRLRATAVMIMICGFPLGSTIGGLISAPLMDAFGWRAIFIMGGIIPLLLLPLLLSSLPESIRFLALGGHSHEKIGQILHQIVPGASVADFIADIRAEKSVAPQGNTVPQLFTGGRAATTALLWFAFFNSLLVYYFLVTWLPTLIHDAGQSLNLAILATAVLNLGGVAGAFVLARFLDKYSPFIVLGLTYTASAIFVAMLAFGATIVPILIVAAALCGFAASGGAIGSNALAAALYPTPIRSTGVGWALGVGRAGAILGPLIAGFLLGFGWTPKAIILSAALPALAASAAVFALGYARRKL